MGQHLTMADGVHRFSSARAIGPVSLSVGPGEVVGLVGSNGSGKTTVLKLALGMLRLHSGAVFLGGRPVIFGRLPPGMSGMVDHPFFHEQVSGPENLVLAAAGRVDRLRRAINLFAEVGLAGREETRVQDYSQGMRQRLAIARVLLGDPACVLLDEPTNGLDPDGIRWVRELVRTLASSGKAVLLSSHLLGELQRVSDRVVIMRTESAPQVLTVAEVVSRGRTLEAVYLGDSEA